MPSPPLAFHRDQEVKESPLQRFGASRLKEGDNTGDIAAISVGGGGDEPE